MCSCSSGGATVNPYATSLLLGPGPVSLTKKGKNQVAQIVNFTTSQILSMSLLDQETVTSCSRSSKATYIERLLGSSGGTVRLVHQHNLDYVSVIKHQ